MHTYPLVTTGHFIRYPVMAMCLIKCLAGFSTESGRGVCLITDLFVQQHQVEVTSFPEDLNSLSKPCKPEFES